jgi:hypothetical protein
MTEKSTNEPAGAAEAGQPAPDNGVVAEGADASANRTEANAPVSPAATPGDPDKAKKAVQDRKAAEEIAGAELAPPPTKAEARKFASGFLLGELIKAVKMHFVRATKPFSQMKEYEQEQLLRQVQHQLEAAVKETIETIAADARLTFRADVESVTFKDGVKASLKLGKSEHAHILADQAGKSVLIVIEDFAKFLNPGEEAKGEPDQPSLFDKSRAAAESVASGGEKPKPPTKKKTPPKAAPKPAKKAKKK